MEDRLFTMAQAAEVCGVAKSTIARARQAGKFPHSQQQPDGSYRIPLGDLIAARFLDRVTSTSSSQGPHKIADATASLHHELAQARHELALATQRAEYLQHLLDTKEESLQALRVAVKALESGYEHTGETTVQNAPDKQPPAKEKSADPAPSVSVTQTPSTQSTHADHATYPGSPLRRIMRTIFGSNQ